MGGNRRDLPTPLGGKTRQHRKDVMKDHGIAATGRFVLLVSALAGLGSLILIPGAAEARSRKGHIGKGGKVGKVGKVGSPARTRGQPAKAACVAAFDKAKELAWASHLREANQWFAICAQSSCDRGMRQRCTTVHTKIAAILPSVVPVVTDAAGALSQEIVVKMDGALLTSNLDGSAIVVDPGEHQFTFAKDGEIFATRRLALEKGQQHQLVSASLESGKHADVEASATGGADAGDEKRSAAAAAAPKPAPPLRKLQTIHAAAESEPVDEEAAPTLLRRENSRRPSEAADARTGAPWSAYALAGVGVLGVGGYFTFNLKGSADNDALVVLCKPNCNPTSVRHVRNIYLAADISLGIGLAALAGSTYLFLRSHGTEEESPRSRTGSITGLSLAPTPSGGVATLGGTF
jgi:hypothetical protein